MPCLEAGEPFQDGQAIFAISVQIYRLFFAINIRIDIQMADSRYFCSASCGLWMPPLSVLIRAQPYISASMTVKPAGSDHREGTIAMLASDCKMARSVPFIKPCWVD